MSLKRGDVIRVELSHPEHLELTNYGRKAADVKSIVIVVSENKNGNITFDSAINATDNDYYDVLLPQSGQPITPDDVEDWWTLTDFETKECLDFLMLWHSLVELDRQSATRAYQNRDEQIKKLRAEADYWKKEYELCENRKDEPQEVEADYSEQGIAEYVAGAGDIHELITIFSSAAFRIAYASEQFADSKERIVLVLDNKEYPLQVAIVKEKEPLRIQTQFEHARFMEVHGLCSKQQLAFREYCKDVIDYYHTHDKSLRGFSILAKKHGVTAMTRDQFLNYHLDDPNVVKKAVENDLFDKLYDECKKR